MKTKDALLTLFENNRGIYFSGEELAERLGVSRTAIWKAVNTLKNDGYEIDAIPSRGYCLSHATDILSLQGVNKYLNDSCRDMAIEVYSEVTSTNTMLKERAANGAPDGTCIIASAQTAGRGRRGRAFYSPLGSGIYLSILLRPTHIDASKAVHVTTMAAVSACEAIADATGLSASIKWVNDIFINEKKVSGILTEAAFDIETNSLEYLVMGIGLNVYPPEGGFPDELSSIAGSILKDPKNDALNAIAGSFLNHFMSYYRTGGNEYVSKYRSLSMAIGREITVLSPQGDKSATAIDVDDECHLIVRYDDGSTEALSSGEISIKLKKENHE